MTPGGSFRCDNAPRFVAGLCPSQQARYRGLCPRIGFPSLAVVPIRHQGQTLGAIHIADEREGMISPACVEFLESISPLIHEAILRFNVEEQMRALNETLEQRAVQLQVLAGGLDPGRAARAAPPGPDPPRQSSANPLCRPARPGPR